MTRKNRSKEINEAEVGIYHITDRCVRRAFLLGRRVDDPETSYGERRKWLHGRLIKLAMSFLIDILGFGILGNHLHLVLRNRPDLVNAMGDEEVVRAWWEVSPQYRRNGKPGQLTPKRQDRLLRNHKHVKQCRERLSSISWFMRYLKHRLAVVANIQDNRSGHIWEARFRCRTVDTIDDLLNTMIYVDLNLIRAGLARTIEESQHTSACSRAERLKQQRKLCRKNTHAVRNRLRELREEELYLELTDEWLSPLQLDEQPAQPRPQWKLGNDTMHRTATEERPAVDPQRLRASDRGILPITTEKYLMIVDLVGRIQRRGKRGKIPPEIAPILDRLGIGTPDAWLDQYGQFAQQRDLTYSRKVNTDEDAALVMLPLVDPSKTNQDAFL